MVYDSVLRNNSQTKYEDDSVDLVFDGNYDRSGPFDTADDHCIKAYNDSTLYCLSIWTTSVLHAWAAVSGGYSIEVAVPWTHFDVSPQAGDSIGFDVGVNDDDGIGFDDLRYNQTRWAGNTDDWWDTSAFGTIVLLGNAPP